MIYFLVILSLFFSIPVYAGNFQLDTTIIGQVRQDEQDRTESPVNGYLGLAVDQPKWHISAETNMRLFRDFNRHFDDYDLYQAVLHIRPIDALQIDFGRQFVNQGFSAEILDGIQLQIMPKGYVHLVLYTGIPRSDEIGDFNKNDGLLSGLTLGLKNVSRTNAQVHAAWRKVNIRFNDLKENDEIFVGANLSHQLDVKASPLFYGLIEYNVAGKVLDAGSGGIDLYPSRRVGLNLEFNVFNVNKESDRPTILGLFTQGRMLSGRFASTWTLIPEHLDLVESYSYQRVEIQSRVHRNGHLIDTALHISFDDLGLHIAPGYYFANSFGGTLHGARISIHEQFTDEFYADVGFDFTTYNKITNDNDNAYSLVAWSGYEIFKGWTVAAGFEYNRNNLLTRDIRGSMQISFNYDRNI